MDLFFISADRPLTKQYTKMPDGSVEKTSYPDVYRVTSHLEQIESIDDFHAAVERHALLGHCMIKGYLHRDLISESRAGATDSGDTTWWVCLDIDGLPTKQSIDEILTSLGLAYTSYIVQWSASQDITSTDLRCHIFMLLDKPVPAPFLKQWLIKLNLSTPLLNDNMQLSRSGNAIRWALDITTCQNDKLIFIAPPVLKKIRDPFKGRSRYELVKKANPTLVLPANMNTMSTNAEQVEQRRRELRKQAGLPVRRADFKPTRMHKDVEVFNQPDRAIVTVDRVGEQFTYLNLNDGDSAAYYHPNDNPEIIYNFKGEPNCVTRELDPDYYKQVSGELKRRQTEAKEVAHAEERAQQIGVFAPVQGPVLLAFRDFASGVYYHGTFDEATDNLELAQAKNEKQVRDFCMQFNMPIGDFVPIWNVIFDPQDNVRVDVANKVVNLFHRTEYMRAEPKKVLRCPATIFKVISHALGGEAAIIEHFVNWLAFIVQQRTRTNTAWVLYGTEGTGKGVLMSKILRPLLGAKQTSVIRAEQLQQPYNTFLKNVLLVFYDEAHIPNMKDPEGVLEKLRNFITEPLISLRAMYANAVEVPNYSNHILASNKPNVITLSNHDRRWNIGRFQHEKLAISKAEFKVLEEGTELQEFYHFLYNYPVDEDAVRTPLVTEDRQELIDTTLSSADEVAQALDARKANMEFFIDQLPTDSSYMSDSQRMNKVENYRAVLLAVIERTNPSDGTCKIARDELREMFEYPVGKIPDTPNKFTKFLAHRHIHTKKVRINVPVYGIEVKWADFKNFKQYLVDYWPTKKTKETRQ